MTTLEALHAAVRTLQAQMRESQSLIRILYDRQRLLRASTSMPQNSSTCGRTGKTNPILTGLGRSAVWRHTAKFLPRLLSWVAEKLLGWIAPWILPALAGAWAMGRDRLESVWAWLIACWHWLGG